MTPKPRKRTRCVGVALGWLLLGFHAAHLFAQAKPTATGPGTSIDVGVLASGFQTDYGKRRVGGAALFADANLTWRLGVEAEARQLRFHEEGGSSQRTYLGGVRYSVRPVGFSPYVKVLAGLGQIEFPYGYATGKYFVLAPGAGLDYRLHDGRIRIRLIDFEYQSWPQFTYGQLNPYGVSAGISVRLWRSETWTTR